MKKSKTFVDHSQTIDDVSEKLEDYNPTKKRSVLIVFDYMIADMKSNKNLRPKVTDLFLKGKTSIFHLFFSPILF